MKEKKWGDISMYKTEVITDNKQNKYEKYYKNQDEKKKVKTKQRNDHNW